MEKRLPRSKFYLLISILIAATSTAVISLSLTGFSFYLLDRDAFPSKLWLFFGLAFIMDGLGQLCLSFKEEYKLMKIDRYVSAFVLVVLGLLNICLPGQKVMFPISGLIYFLVLLTHTGLTFVHKHNARQIVMLSLLVAINVALLVGSVIGFDLRSVNIPIILFSALLSIIALGNILREAFAKIHMKALGEVFKKTFAGEILLGLAFLIVAFSFVFSIMEKVSYGDALWYCFAIVTTIGFGDVVLVSPFCRFLSVILGIYGIIVVALITSVIINFYNEVKDSHKKEDEDKTKEKEEDK